MLHSPDLQRALHDLQPRRVASRRLVLTGLAGLLPAWLVLGPLATQAKKKHKKKRNKPQNNAFGCLNVGQHCNGKDSKCCSGVCDGKKPKKGKKDKSTCVAHNVGPCQDAFDVCAGVAVPCSLNNQGGCFKTTGNAPFCAAGNSDCTPCKRDADCVALGFGFGAACVVCNVLCATESGGTVCYAAGV
ncbi:MAG: hypothetical protein KC442_19480 [Thermomicrobiales bacterium]|nr:hypothetical protein [Thermomicrobiales bacterium]